MKTQRQRKAVFILVAALGILPLTWNACSQGPLGLSQQSEAVLTIGGGGTGLSFSELSAKSNQILTSSCASCHTATGGPAGVYNLTDVNHLKSSSLIIPGQPSQSVLYQSMSTGSMPPGGAMSAGDLAIIRDWIIALSLQSGGGPTPTPSPGPSPTPGPTPSPTPGASPTPSPTPVSFATLKSTILDPKCVGCHNATTMRGGYNLSTYTAVRNSVNLANPAASVLYTSVTTGGMPAGGTPLSAAERNSILLWIQQGAPNN